MSSYQCEECDYTTHSKSGLGIHFSNTHGKPVVDCEWCGEEFTHPPSQKQKFCSYECSNKWKSEEYAGRNKPWLENKKEFDCDWCNKTFKKVASQENDNNFCSVECYNKWQKENISGDDLASYKGGQVTLECNNCEDRYKVYPFRADTSKYCSNSCRSSQDRPQLRNKVKLICKSCGKIYLKIYSKRHHSKFCSQNCFGDWISKHRNGKNNPTYKENGKNRLPTGPKWKKKRKEAIERDNEKCIRCGMNRKTHYDKYNKDLNVDHIKPRREFLKEHGYIPKEANKLENLQTLCVSCHTKEEFSKQSSPMVGR